MEKVLRIELLSDLCVSDGGVYNSAVDIDSCYDQYGLPYIPAKRLKGLFRESAENLEDWGMIKKETADSLFGKPGEASGKATVIIRNAELEYRDQYVAEIIGAKNTLVYHRQNVFDCFSYLRAQTSVNYETGAAVEGLRTTRVVAKGLCFCASVYIESGSDENGILESFNKIVTVTEHIGMNRTRGLGKVRMSITDPPRREEKSECSLRADPECLEYTIFLKSPVICKSIKAGETETLDYIDGAKMLGTIAGRMKRSGIDFAEYMEKNPIRVTNAYICDRDGNRSEEVSKSLYSIKNNKREYIDKIYPSGDEDRNLQLNTMKHCYTSYQNGRLDRIHVSLETRYHHRRPKDKGIGRSVSTEEGGLYQMESISADQVFKGRIYGDPEKLKTIYSLLMKDPVCNIGYAVSSEYGWASVSVEPVSAKPAESEGELIAVKLLAPAIIYNDKAFYSTDGKDLIQEIKSALLLEDSEIGEVVKFLSYVNVGGFNTTWGKRKPTVTAFDKGSVILFRMKNRKRVKLPATPFIGERTVEGFGEISLIQANKDGSSKQEYYSEKTEENLDKINADGELASLIIPRLFKEFSVNEAIRFTETLKPSLSWRSTISNLISMCSENTNIEDVSLAMKKRYAIVNEGEKDKARASERKREKLRIAENIINNVKKEYPEIEGRFCREYRLAKGHDNKNDAEMQLAFLSEVLKQYKYLIRGGKE